MSAESPGQGWFDVRPVTDGVTAIAEPGHVEHVISYLIEGRDRAVLLDTGMGVGNIAACVAQLTDKPISVVNSHAHWDHIGDNWRFDDIAIHPAEADRLPEGVSHGDLRPWFDPRQLTRPLPPGFDLESCSIRPSTATQLLNDGDWIELGDRRLHVIHAPGHSPGGIVLFDPNARWLFSTDVAYPSVLFAYGEDVDFVRYRQTMHMLADMAGDLAGVSGSHDGVSMPPSMLRSMAAALNSIADGRAPDERTDEFDHHVFNGFRVYAPPTLDGVRGAE